MSLYSSDRSFHKSVAKQQRITSVGISPKLGAINAHAPRGFVVGLSGLRCTLLGSGFRDPSKP